MSFDDAIKPLRVQQEAIQAAEKAASDKAAQDAADAETARVAAQNTPILPPVSAPIYTPPSAGTLTGSIGYALPWGNCVLEPGVNNPGFGNPIIWPVLTQTPHIGSTALFWFNHVAVVTGFWSNGDIEVRQQNTSGGVHRYPRSMFRGFR